MTDQRFNSQSDDYPARDAYRTSQTVSLDDTKSTEFTAAGVRYIRMVELSSTNVTIKIDDGPPMTVFKGWWVKFTTPISEKIEVINETGAALTFELAYGTAELGDDRVNFGSGIDLTKPSTRVVTEVVCANAAATQILAADTTRREWVLFIPDTAAAAMKFGNSAAEALAGYPIVPGGQFGLADTDALYLRNDTGAAVTVVVVETRD